MSNVVSDDRIAVPRDTAAVVPLLLTDNEAASLLRVSRTSIWQLMRSGALAWLKVGHARRIPAAGVRDFITQRLAEQAVVGSTPTGQTRRTAKVATTREAA